jgi:sulfur carrier protein
MPLLLILNGQSRTFNALQPLASLDQFVAELDLRGDRVAVEHNGVIVSRSSWSQTILAEGDRIEVVHFVGGGSDSQSRP